MKPAPLLDHAPLFRSACADETADFLGAKDHLFSIARPGNGLDVRLNGVYLPGFYVGYLAYGEAEVSSGSGPSHTEYWLHLPLEGALRARQAEQDVIALGSSGLLLAPSQRRWQLTARPGSARLQLALDRAAMIRRLEALLDDALAGPLEFEPAIDLGRGCGRSIAAHLLLAVRDLGDPGSGFAEPLTLAAFEDYVMTALLMGHPNSHSAALRRRDRRLAPRDVKRASDYIRDHLHLPIGIAEIAAAAGVPGRTLFKHFRDFLGITPMGYLRQARMAQARAALRSATDADNVTAIATACGFSHLGRFSLDYRRAFGESPSATLASSRPRPARGPG